jgi:hypothetical protein
MVTPLSVRDAGAPFTSSFVSTYESRPVADSTSRPVRAPLSDFEAIAGSYPVYRIVPS